MTTFAAPAVGFVPGQKYQCQLTDRGKHILTAQKKAEKRYHEGEYRTIAQRQSELRRYLPDNDLKPGQRRDQ